MGGSEYRLWRPPGFEAGPQCPGCVIFSLWPLVYLISEQRRTTAPPGGLGDTGRPRASLLYRRCLVDSSSPVVMVMPASPHLDLDLL